MPSTPSPKRRCADVATSVSPSRRRTRRRSGRCPADRAAAARSRRSPRSTMAGSASRRIDAAWPRRRLVTRGSVVVERHRVRRAPASAAPAGTDAAPALVAGPGRRRRLRSRTCGRGRRARRCRAPPPAPCRRRLVELVQAERERQGVLVVPADLQRPLSRRAGRRPLAGSSAAALRAGASRSASAARPLVAPSTSSKISTSPVRQAEQRRAAPSVARVAPAAGSSRRRSRCRTRIALRLTPQVRQVVQRLEDERLAVVRSSVGVGRDRHGVCRPGPRRFSGGAAIGVGVEDQPGAGVAPSCIA